MKVTITIVRAVKWQCPFCGLYVGDLQRHVDREHEGE